MRVAIIGGGQLARMLALSGMPLGVSFCFLLHEHQSNDCVRDLGTCVWQKQGMDTSALHHALGKPDVYTIESENIASSLVEQLATYARVAPNRTAIDQLNNRLREKAFLVANGVATASYVAVHNYQELLEGIDAIGLPVVIKAGHGGYDGKNQYILRQPADISTMQTVLNTEHAKKHGYIAEAFVPFIKELSFIAARATDGSVVMYPATENVHQDGILIKSIAPAAELSKAINQQAQAFLHTIVEQLQYVGVLAMECFLVHDDAGERLIVNELAPRVHNSGHWTQNGCITSQFENHIRAVCGMTLGDTKPLCVTGMLNVLGKGSVTVDDLPANAALHWYNKQPQLKRKMGHVNFMCTDYPSLLAAMTSVEQYLLHS